MPFFGRAFFNGRAAKLFARIIELMGYYELL
jgi:hypothetical protein